MRFVFVASLLALVLAATALAVPSAAPDPSRLVLARSDFPAGTQYSGQDMPASYIKALAKSGIKAKAKSYYVDFHSGHSVSGIVTTTEATSQAAKLYKFSKADMLSKRTEIRLPRYGDEQIALVTKHADKVELLVRKNRAVWEVEALLGVPEGGTHRRDHQVRVEATATDRDRLSIAYEEVQGDERVDRSAVPISLSQGVAGGLLR